uniref:Uncharacterized protein n=1 Tax=Auxenochlorella protothecoides TaxID=3075 RepID=A0A1D2A1B7_AUXPR
MKTRMARQAHPSQTEGLHVAGARSSRRGPSSPARVSQPGERACHLGAAAPHQSGSAGATEAMLGLSMQSSGSLPSDTPPIPILRWGHRNRRLNSQPELGASEEQYPQCWGRTFPPTSGHRNALLRPSVQPVARPIWSPTSAFQPYALSTAPEPGTSGMVPPAANPAEWARPSREYAQAEHGTGEQAREPRPLSDAHERYTGLDAPDTLQRTSEAHQHGPAARQSPPGAPEPPKATRRQLLNVLRLLRILGQRQQIEARRDPPAYHGGSFHGAGC